MTPRRFRHTDQVLLADAAPDGRARLDALARWLQDAAYLDVHDAGFGDPRQGGWVVRRSRLRIERFPRFPEPVELVTWCSGLGASRMWAERRTTIAGGAVEATALWVHVDPDSGRPRPLSDEQLALWRSSAGDRRVRARLSHPEPPDDAGTRDWRFRAADLDVAGHVNNAAYWTVVEEDLGDVTTPVVFEVEHRGAAAAGDALVRTSEDRWWVCGDDGEIHASLARTVDA